LRADAVAGNVERRHFGGSVLMAEYRYFGTLRFLLAICVVLQHFGSQIAPPVLSTALNPLTLGNCAVVAFFVLSGFIIAEAAERFYKDRAAAFLVNRVLRLVPPFIVAMTATVGIHATMDAIDDAAVDDSLLSAYSILINYFSIFPLAPFPGHPADPSKSFILAVWALRVEFLFYIAFAVVIALASRRAPNRILAAAGTLAFGAFLLNRLGYAPRALQFGPYFVFGVAYFYALRGSVAAKWFSLVALAAMIWQFAGYDARSPLAAIYDRPAQMLILLAMLLAFMVLAQLRAEGEAWSGIRKADQALGDLSYVIYLNHAAVQALFIRYAEPTVLSFFLALGLTLLYALAMMALTEPPLRLLRDHVRGTGLSTGRRLVRPRASPP
jgi:peptidoglycan/LPS O-acetylase OafA/YrhL